MSLSERLNRGVREYVGQHPQVKDPTGLEGFKGQLAVEQWDERFQVGLRIAQLLQFGDSLGETIKNVFDPHERKQLLATMAAAATQIAYAAPASAEGNTPPAIVEPVNTPSGRMPSSEAADQLVFVLPRSESAFAKPPNTEGNVTEPQPLLSIPSLEAIINEEGMTGEWVPLTGEALPKAIQDYIRQQLDLGVDPRVFAEFAEIKVQQDGVQKITVKNITPDVPIPLLPYQSKLVEQVGVFNPEQNQIDVGVRTMLTKEQEFALLAKDNKGTDIAFAVLPSISRLSERLTPTITSAGNISYIDDQGDEVVSRGPISDVLNNKSSQPHFDMLTQVTVIKEGLVSEGGGGEASTAFPEHQATMLKKISSVTIDGNARLFTIPWVDATYYVPLPSGLIKPDGVFQMILDEATKTYKLTTDKGEQLAQFDPTHGMLWFNGESDGGKIRSQPRVDSSTETGQTTRQKEAILIAGRWKPDGDQNYWYRLSLGWQRADLAHPSEAINSDLLPQIQPDDTDVVASPVIPETFDKQFSIPAPSAALQKEAGITDLAQVIYEVNADMSDAPQGMVRAYLNGVHALSAEYNPANKSWEWKEPAMEGVPYPDQELVARVQSELRRVQLSKTEAISYEALTDNQGNPYFYALDTETGIPLSVCELKDGQWVWSEATLGGIADKKDVIVRLAANVHKLPRYEEAVEALNGYSMPDGHMRDPNYKRSPLRPTAETFDFSAYDSALDGLTQQGKDIQFFHLLWGYKGALPDWLLNGNFTAKELLTIADEHIAGVMGHYTGKINRYVVANEPWGNPWDTSNSKFWTDELGDPMTWVPGRVKVAHETDPDATLLIGDFGIEIPGSQLWNAEKEPKFFALAKKIHDEGTPVTAGLQMPVYASDFAESSRFDALMDAYRAQLKKYSAAGIPVSITEFRFFAETIDTKLANVANPDQLKAKIVEGILNISYEEGVTDITFFGTPGGGGNEEQPLFDSSGKPTAAYYTAERATYKK